jgi:hypothetical protein
MCMGAFPVALSCLVIRMGVRSQLVLSTALFDLIWRICYL